MKFFDTITRVRWLPKGPLAVIEGLFVRLPWPPIVALPVVVDWYTIDRYFVRGRGKPGQLYTFWQQYIAI